MSDWNYQKALSVNNIADMVYEDEATADIEEATAPLKAQVDALVELVEALKDQVRKNRSFYETMHDFPEGYDPERRKAAEEAIAMDKAVELAFIKCRDLGVNVESPTAECRRELGLEV